LYYIKPDYTDSKVNVMLYDYIKLRANIFVEFYITDTNHRQGLYIRGLRRHRPKQKPAAAVIFAYDKNRLPPMTKIRRRRRIAVAVYDKNPPPQPMTKTSTTTTSRPATSTSTSRTMSTATQ
jgi:hypothetical protein